MNYYTDPKNKIVDIAKECDINGLVKLANELDPECNAVNPFFNREHRMYFCFGETSFSFLVADDYHDGATGYFEKYEEGDITGEIHTECLGLGVIPFKETEAPDDKYSDVMDFIVDTIKSEDMTRTETINYLYRSDISHLLDFSKWNIKECIED